ncbi:L-tyrosine 3-hydroxylase [Actinokineospora terrae]|uniref:L-tyrosine 3-hydroxylase n=1 Tax=Actinokineospora terrae TaxID=155974 RepID=A0A1H9KWT8_9PSEU|nr:L-tyrosine 3-hydroxylase [Actinokineospora terrae]SER03337.1 hypothetical protein SAMN04487818_101345 [Actinokineospora terrae]
MTHDRRRPQASTDPALQPRLLFLPATDGDYADSDDTAHGADLDHLPDYTLFGTRPVEARRVFWYRWLAGHQISFALWRAMSDVVSRRGDDLPSERELEVLTSCIDGYSAMLLYSATVPRDHYHANIRTRMALQHPSFSGAWAPDYKPIRLLFRGRFDWQDDPSCRELDEAVARNRRTHDFIADHLVPDGRSLLQKSAGTVRQGVSRDKEDLYDNFFLTIRRPVGHAELVTQLDDRVAELAEDLAHHGLYPEVDGRHHPVVTGRPDPALRPLVAEMPATLRRAAHLVAGMRYAGARS